MFASFFARALTRLRSSTTTLDQLAASEAAANGSSEEAQAFAEGWGVFDCGCREDGSRRIELQRLDSHASGTASFDSDYAAWQHVAAAAKAGSRLHAAALSSLDPAERLAIEAACGCAPACSCPPTISQKTSPHAYPSGRHARPRDGSGRARPRQPR